MRHYIKYLLVFSCLFSSNAFAGMESDDDCVLAYFMEESSGNAEDSCSTGTDYDGTVGTGVTYSVTGTVGDGFEFDGTSNGNVLIGDIAEVDALTEMSICAWVNHDVSTADEVIASKVISNGFIFKRDDTNDTYETFLFDSDDADTASLNTANSSSTTGTWTHVCTTIELGSATGLRMYVDGVEDVNSPADISSITAMDAGGGVLRVGSSSSNTSGFFDGKMDEFILLGRVLSSSEIQGLHDNGIEATLPDPPSSPTSQLIMILGD